MVYYSVRGLFVLLFTATSWQLGASLAGDEQGVSAWAIAGVILGGLLAGLLVALEAYFTQKGAFYSVIAGVVLGLLISVFFTQFVSYIPDNDGSLADGKRLLELLITVCCCYLSTVLVLKARGNYRLLIPFVELKPHGPQRKKLLLDRSVAVDGRIADVAATSLIDSPMFIPDFVVQELHGLADSSDPVARVRGRRALDVIKTLQSNAALQVEVMATRADDPGDHDARIIALARDIGGRLITNDFNLNKVAQLQGIEVVNLNEVAQAMRVSVIPGEEITVHIVRAGEESDQGVGFLEDGTMVVVEGARDRIGEDVPVEVTSVLQRSAGRMIFARVKGASDRRGRRSRADNGRRSRDRNSRSDGGEPSGEASAADVAAESKRGGA